MIDIHDVDTSTVALALMRSGKLTSAAARNLLLAIRKAHGGSVPSAAVVELAELKPGEINASLTQANDLVQRGLDGDVHPIPISSDSYPRTLRGIADAPPVIYVRGSADALKQTPGISVVGTRKASPHGIKIAERIAAFLSDNDICVVSGLALGIDAAAHEGALKGASPTIAVLAHGLEKANPRANAPLAQRILEAGGAWVSEHPVLTSPKPDYFVLRNRIQVGLSAASIIVEGEEHSGSATQAEYCIRNRRVLFAVLPASGAGVSTQNRLPHVLVQSRGAVPIRSKDDYDQVLELASLRKAELIDELGAT
jgi:DNA processing protein